MGHILRCSGYELLKTDIIQSKGSYLYDNKGNRFVDFESGVWCTVLGHNYHSLNTVIKEQLDKTIHLGYRYTNESVELAGKKILEVLQMSSGKCLFLSSGSEVVELGVQVGRTIMTGTKFLTLSNTYLSAYGSSKEKEASKWYHLDWQCCSSCSQTECSINCPHLQEIPWEDIGAFVFEPGNTSGLVKLPPKRLIKVLDNMRKKQQGLLIVDEVTTGLGRTGQWFGFQHYDLQPDIVALGKGLGNGYPVSALAMTEQVIEKLNRHDFHYAQSHQNDALGCVIATKVLSILDEEELIKRSNRLGALFLDNLRKLKEDFSYIKEIRGRGLMIGVEWVSDINLTYIHGKLLSEGYLVGYKPAVNLLRFYPPLTIEEKHILHMLSCLRRILEELTRAGFVSQH